MRPLYYFQKVIRFNVKTRWFSTALDTHTITSTIKHWSCPPTDPSRPFLELVSRVSHYMRKCIGSMITAHLWSSIHAVHTTDQIEIRIMRMICGKVPKPMVCGFCAHPGQKKFSYYATSQIIICVHRALWYNDTTQTKKYTIFKISIQFRLCPTCFGRRGFILRETTVYAACFYTQRWAQSSESWALSYLSDCSHLSM